MNRQECFKKAFQFMLQYSFMSILHMSCTFKKEASREISNSIYTKEQQLAQVSSSNIPFAVPS